MFTTLNIFLSAIVFASIVVLLQLRHGWKTSGVHSRTDSFTIFSILGGLGWLLYLIVSSIIYHTVFRPQDLFQPSMIFSFWIPTVLLISTTGYFFVRDQIYKYVELKQQKAIVELEKECKQWTKQFMFVKPQDVEVKIYIANYELRGRLHVSNISKENSEILEIMKHKLPKNIYLKCFTL